MDSTNLLIPYALQNGCIIHVDHVPSGLACNCNCPTCHQRLVAHKGQVQAHHFQHEAGATACETQLHGTAKWMMYERIDAAIAKGEPLPVRWQCWKCPCIHDGDLLGDTRDVFQPEEPLPDSRIIPDLWLSADHGITPSAFVEIVVTHEPEAGTKDYARERNLPIWEFHLKEAEDLEKLKATPLLPDVASVPYCLCLLCPGCNRRPCFMNMRDHRWCETCKACYRTDSAGGVHQHCTDCGEILNPYAAAAGYARCSECYSDGD